MVHVDLLCLAENVPSNRSRQQVVVQQYSGILGHNSGHFLKTYFLEGLGFFVARHRPKCPQPIFEGFLWVYPGPRASYIALFSVLV